MLLFFAAKRPVRTKRSGLTDQREVKTWGTFLTDQREVKPKKTKENQKLFFLVFVLFGFAELKVL